MQDKLKAAEGERDALAKQAEALKQATDSEKLATVKKLAAAQKEAEEAAALARQHLAEKQGMVSTI